MSEQPPARKRHRSDDSSDEKLSKKPKFRASTSGLQCDNHLQLIISEGMQQLSEYQSDLRRGCVAAKGSILAVLDAMRVEIIGSAASDKRSLRLILPDEVLLDVFVYLDRLRLERLQPVCRRFRTVIDLHMTDACYRVINTVHIRRSTVTAWIGDREYGPLYGTPLLTSDVSEHGERRTIIASELGHYKDHMADVLVNVCRNANVLVYKISNVWLSQAGLELRETWQKLVPANANLMTISELVLDGCTVEVPGDGSKSSETIIKGMLESFRRVHGVRLSIDVKSYGRDAANRDGLFTDGFLKFSAAHDVSLSVDLPHWDRDITEKGVLDFLLNAPSDRCKRELSFYEASGVTARFYDALVKASTECATAHTASLGGDCDPDSLPQGQVRDADEEVGCGWGGTQYRFFRGLLPFSITGESSCSGTFFSYERGADACRDEDEGGDDEPAQDGHVEEDDGNRVELDDLELVDEC